ncbi:MAG TPA: proton-conducting transporter membrane subunit, partial [Chloroflexota bacterium]|nr:proton-conducting transporter membrane subunit [Chloroflexota bacterium]
VLVGMATYTRIGVAGAALHMAHRALTAFVLAAAAHELEQENRGLEEQPPTPYLWLALLLAVLAMTGVPPLAGFGSRWAVLQAASLVDWRLAAGLMTTSAVALLAALTALGRLRRTYPAPWRRPTSVEVYLLGAATCTALWAVVPGPMLGALHDAVSELTFLKPF